MIQTSRSFLQVHLGCNQASSFDCFSIALQLHGSSNPLEFALPPNSRSSVTKPGVSLCYISVDNDNGSSRAAHHWCPDSTKLLEFFSHVILNCKTAQVKASFRPEFVNRVDEFVVFEALKLNEIRQIVRLQAKRVEQRLAEKKIKLELDESAVDYLAVRVPSLTLFEMKLHWQICGHMA